MKTQIIKIGNSKGIRIPKPLLEQSNLDGEVELEVCSEGLLIKSSEKPRYNWAKAFMEMAEEDEDEMIIEDSATKFEKEDWQW
jgi:antitoxin MazE